MVVVYLALLAAGAEAPVSIDAFLDEFAERRAGIHAMEAAFVQENISPDDQYRSTGRILYARPRRIMFSYEDPELVYLVDEMKVYEYDALLEQVQIYDLTHDAGTEALFLAFDSDTSRLRKAYDVSLFDPGDVEGVATGLELRPKPPASGGPGPAEGEVEAGAETEEEVRLFEWVRLYLREGDYLPCWIHVQNSEDSEVVMRIAEIRINDAADAGALHLDLPEGTLIIDNEERVEAVGEGGRRIPAAPAAEAPDGAAGKGEDTP